MSGISLQQALDWVGSGPKGFNSEAALELLRHPGYAYRLAAWLQDFPRHDRLTMLNRIRRSLADRRSKTALPISNFENTPRPDAARDPLVALHRELEIRRFITTNYDHEIERMLLYRGHTPFKNASQESSSTNVESRDPLARKFEEVVFDEAHTGELIALATSDKSQDAWVIHLHGKADIEGGGDIVATEDDYQKRYARKDRIYPFVDEAISLTFAANPILFVGIGMNEIDLLRPLREFMSNPSRLGDRFVIAVLPQKGSNGEKARHAIKLLRQYGVYSLYYGAALLEGRSNEEEYWLHKIGQLRKAIDNLLQEIGDPNPKNKTGDEWEQKLREYRKKQAELKKLSARLMERNRMLSPISLDSVDRRYDGNLKQDVKILSNSLTFCLRRELSQRRKEAVWTVAEKHRIQVRGAYQSIQTACLTAYLERIGSEWKNWRHQWQTPPKTRPTKILGRNAKLTFSDGRKFSLLHIRRHTIDLPAIPDKADENNLYRFFSGAPSQTFNTLEKALRNAHHLRNVTERRIFLLIAERGVGKGHFFAALSNSEERLAHFLEAIGAKDTDWAGAAFFNLSFSLEVSSIVDELAEFLYGLWGPHAEPGDWRGSNSNLID